MLSMAAGDRQGGAAGVAGLSADGVKQQWPTGDRFAMMIGVGEPHEQVPPVEDQRDVACYQTAALEVAGREAAPAPLVFQLVEAVLAIGAVAIELAERKNLAVERGDQNGVFPNLAAVVDLGKAEPQLACIIVFSQRQGALKASPQDHDATMPAPSLKAQLAVLALPSAACILPVLLTHRPFDRALHSLRQPQFEQVGLVTLLGFTHHRLVAETGIAVQHPRPQFRRQPTQEPPPAAPSNLRSIP